MAICLTDPFLPTSNATMQKLFIATAVALTAASAMAQVPNCNTAPPAQVFSNRADFGADFYYNLGAHIFDLNVTAPITLTGARTWLYDQGVGNPPVPDQRGNTSIVDVYTIAGTRTGNETNQPAWTLIGSGTMIVTDTAVGDGESQINFPNLAIAAGTYGVAFVYNAPTAGLNPGPLHCLGVAPAIVPPPVSDQFVTFSNEGIQGTAWTGVGVDSPNLRLQYTPNPSSAWFRQGGDGCYFRPHSFYESFPSAAGNRDLVNTGMQWLNGGTSWLVIPGPAGIIPPSGTPLNAGPTGSSSSGNWDDALSAPITLPFTFNFPGGSTTDITVSSNGSVYLANVVDSNYSICGASYGSILPFRDGPARISGFYHDMDPGTGGTGAGDIYYEVDTFNQYVRVTWDNVQEWGVPGALVSMQITLYSSGNVDIAYGSNLSNQSAGNNAIVGFTPGLGSRLPPAIDISAALPYQAGDGQIPPVLGMSARPILGTTPNFVTTNVTPGTFAQIFVISLQGLPTPVDLAPFGLPGCFQHIVPLVTNVNFLTPNNTFEQSFGIPLDVSYQNVQFFAQAAPLTAGLNPANVVTSNGVCARLHSL
jgi:hypothetical protein